MKVKFVPQNIEIEIKPNESVLHLAQDHGIHIKSICRGIPSCAECRVFVTEGEHNVLPPSTAELNLIGTAYFVDGRRLSCQLKCFGDITINLSEQIEKANSVVASKRPRGARIIKESSSAVMGNIMQENLNTADIDERVANINLEIEERALQLRKIKSKHNPKTADPRDNEDPDDNEDPSNAQEGS